MLSEVDFGERGRALALIAEHAPSLGEAELRVLLGLSNLFAGNGGNSGRISSRVLAARLKMSRSWSLRLAAAGSPAKRPGESGARRLPATMNLLRPR